MKTFLIRLSIRDYKQCSTKLNNPAKCMALHTYDAICQEKSCYLVSSHT